MAGPRTNILIKPQIVAAGVGQLSSTYTVPAGKRTLVKAGFIVGQVATNTLLVLDYLLGAPPAPIGTEVWQASAQFAVRPVTSGMVLLEGEQVRFRNANANGSYVVWLAGIEFTVS